VAKTDKGYTQARLIYRREGDSYVLYSVGANMKDDGGVQFEPRANRKKGDIIWRGKMVTEDE